MIFGVAGSGKTTLGRAVAARLGWRFLDADDLHPAENWAKMSAGIPLTDADRKPWLARVALVASEPGTVLAASLLREAYRDQIRRAAPHALLIGLALPLAEAEARVASRLSHAFPSSLVASQYEAWEPPPQPCLDATLPVSELIELIVASIRFHPDNRS